MNPRPFSRFAEVFITDDGHELIESNLNILDIFSKVVESELSHPEGRGEYEFIGMGKHGRVSAVPEIPEICVKMSSSQISKQAHFLGDPKKGDPEDLIVQTMFLDRVRSELSAKPEDGISVPRQYMAARSSDGVFVSLQERVVSPFRTVSSLSNGWKFDDDYRSLVGLICDRTSKALADTVLRFAVDDIWRNGRMNAGNVLIDTTNSDDFISLANADLYVIDQPSHRFKTARAVMKLAKVV